MNEVKRMFAPNAQITGDEVATNVLDVHNTSKLQWAFDSSPTAAYSIWSELRNLLGSSASTPDPVRCWRNGSSQVSSAS
jgi:hypothetical protein